MKLYNHKLHLHSVGAGKDLFAIFQFLEHISLFPYEYTYSSLRRRKTKPVVV